MEKQNKDFIGTMKETLEEEKDRIEKDLAKFARKKKGVGGEYDSNFPDYGDDQSENAAEVAQYDTNLAVEQALEKKLRDIKKSLTRIEDGSYGICKDCEKPIEEGRLKALPAAGSCVSWKTALTKEVEAGSW